MLLLSSDCLTPKTTNSYELQKSVDLTQYSPAWDVYSPVTCSSAVVLKLPEELILSLVW